jgi:hypothetical protein
MKKLQPPAVIKAGRRRAFLKRFWWRTKRRRVIGDRFRSVAS